MKGDFTRSTFKPEKHYSSVRMQQGRVQLDADWNEQMDIQAYLQQSEAGDVIGLCGVPKIGGGFKIDFNESDLTISPGRIYVAGILCENEVELESTYSTQVDYPDPSPSMPLDTAEEAYLVYLDVWQRHITAVDDPQIREVALGGPDTATRTRTLWQVKLESLKNLAEAGSLDCSQFCADWVPKSANSSGQLQARAVPAPPDDKPCIVPPKAGYRRLENQLYRVEIHKGGTLDGGAGSSKPTFKWSRDNGSIVTQWLGKNNDDLTVSSIGRDSVIGFAAGQWVELTDETHELKGLPGTLVKLIKAEGQALTIDPATAIGSVDPANFPRNPKVVRRWDSQGELAVEIPGTNDGWIPLEDGVEIHFKEGTYNTGDYWMIPARTVVGNVLWPIDEVSNEPAFEERHGIKHHYCALALLTWQNGESKWKVEDCRRPFPSLNNIWAEDVYYDNSECSLIDTKTVQDALDRLCKQRDLRHHNKHLHGWGIVCGLQVVCDPGDLSGRREHVIVQNGYAIDCEGNDICLEQPEVPLRVNVLDWVRQYNAEHPADQIPADAEICLTLEHDVQRGVYVGFERYKETKNDFIKSLLSGTLLLDFYKDCIWSIVDFVRNEFTPQPDEKEALVGPTQKRITTFLNLLIQLAKPAYGRYVFLSNAEHNILKGFYDGLLGHLKSETFCAMFENARRFPDPYPFAAHNISTVFGKGNHRRLRIHPGGRFGYTCGAGNKIHVYNLASEEMVAVLEVPGGEGLVVQDVAFSQDGKQLYAIATLRDKDTIFAVADISNINESKYIWRPVNMLCDLQLMTIATAEVNALAGAPRYVYAVAKGEGLYRINPESSPVAPEQLCGFNAVGHLVIDREKSLAYASARGKDLSPDVYDRVLELKLTPDGQPLNEFNLKMASGELLTGSDDIAVASVGNRHGLFAVAESPSGKGNKILLRFNALDSKTPPNQVDLQENTEVRLGHIPDSAYLMLTMEDSYRLRMVDINEPYLVDEYKLPVQISPLAIAYAPKGKKAYILNNLSNTITSVPLEYLDPSKVQGAAPVPGNQAFLNALETYRKGIFDAFTDLLGGFLQYLKDCFCHHFLVNCPECDPDDKIYLACASLRNNQVYKICNFSRRKYVKSFPTIEYWLSLIPIAPLISKAIEKFCCATLPDIFAKFTAPAADARGVSAKGAAMRNFVGSIQSYELRSTLRNRMDQLKLARQLTTDWVGNKFAKQPKPSAIIKHTDIQGLTVAEASRRMEEAKVTVAKVEVYDPARGVKNLSRLTQMPLTLKADSRVTLYTQDDKVLYYNLTEEAPESVEGVHSELQVQKAKLEESNKELEFQRKQLQVLESKQIELKAEIPTESIKVMESSLESQKAKLTQNEQTLDAVRKQLQTLEQKQESLRIEMAKITKMEEEFRGLLEEIKRFTRPVR